MRDSLQEEVTSVHSDKGEDFQVGIILHIFGLLIACHYLYSVVYMWDSESGTAKTKEMKCFVIKSSALDCDTMEKRYKGNDASNQSISNSSIERLQLMSHTLHNNFRMARVV